MPNTCPSSSTGRTVARTWAGVGQSLTTAVDRVPWMRPASVLQAPSCVAACNRRSDSFWRGLAEDCWKSLDGHNSEVTSSHHAPDRGSACLFISNWMSATRPSSPIVSTAGNFSGTAVVSLQVPSERGSRKGDAGAARMCRRSERCGQIGFTAFLEHLRGVITRFDQSGATAESFGRCRWDL